MEKVEVITTVNKEESGIKGTIGSLNIRNLNIKAGSDVTLTLSALASGVVIFPVNLTAGLFSFIRSALPLDFEFQLFIASTTTGTIAVINGSKAIVGSSTLFMTELAQDDIIVVDPIGLREVLLASSITDNTNAAMKYSVSRETGSGLTYEILKPDSTWHKLTSKQFVADGLFISGMRVSNPHNTEVGLKFFMAGL